MFKTNKRVMIHNSREKGLNRFFWHVYDRAGKNEIFDGHLETSWRKKPHGCGIKFHIGDRGSETPVDAMVDLGWVAFYLGLNAKGLGALCEKIGQGHKRDISLVIHHGALWWKLWFDDDMGYDRHHNCDSWRKPKLWPWSKGREKHRPWMCLRDGNIDLNPLDAIWGSRYFHYEDVAKATARVGVDQFPHDFYFVQFTLQRMTRGRNFGPRWASRRTDEGWVADWKAPDKHNAIPVENDNWKGDEIWGSGERVETVDGWLAQAMESLIRRVKRDREKNRYDPWVNHCGRNENGRVCGYPRDADIHSMDNHPDGHSFVLERFPHDKENVNNGTEWKNTAGPESV